MPRRYYEPTTECGYHAPKAMKDVWDVQLELAAKFKEVCQRHGLKFWLEGGSLLGAIRHKGFIPWDDDIDLMMMRKDYDRLNKIAEQEFIYPYFWQTTYSEEHLYVGHAILRHQETSDFSKDELSGNYCKGIGVDIFVYDNVPTNAIAYALHRMAAKLLTKLIRKAMKTSTHGLHKKLFKGYEALFRCIKKSDTVGAISWKYRHKLLIPKASFDHTEEVDFADTKMPIPLGWKECLVSLYGKSYLIPQNLPSFHGRKYMDAHTPYNQSIAEVRKHPETYDEKLKELYPETNL